MITRLAIAFVLFVGCSIAGMDHVEALHATRGLYLWEQRAAVVATCGGAMPCAGLDEARDAVKILRARWMPVFHAWGKPGVAAQQQADEEIDYAIKAIAP